MQEENLKQQLMIISKLLKKPENRRCADCKRINPTWADIKIGVFLCDKCANLHKELGNLSIIKSISKDLWPLESLEYFSKLNNIISNSYWEFNLQDANFNQVLENDNLLKNFIINKYFRKLWINKDLPDPMTLVINGIDLIQEYAKAGFAPLPEEEEINQDNNNKFKGVTKEKYIQEKIIQEINGNNNAKLVDFDDDKEKKGFSFIKKKQNNENNTNTNMYDFIHKKNININQNIQTNQINNNNNIKKDSNLVDLFNVETKETQAFDYLKNNLQNAYSQEENEKSNKEEQEKNFQYIMGMQVNNMGNNNIKIDLYNHPQNQNTNFNYQYVNGNVNNNQKKKDDPFSNLVQFK